MKYTSQVVNYILCTYLPPVVINLLAFDFDKAQLYCNRTYFCLMQFPLPPKKIIYISQQLDSISDENDQLFLKRVTTYYVCS